MEAAPSLSSPLGRVSISHAAVAHVVGHVAAEACGAALPVTAVEVRIEDVKRSTT